MLKRISEEKILTARKAYGRDKFSFRSLALPILAGNSFPSTTDSSWGMLRRIQVIPFKHVFLPGDADPNLFPQIWKKELPGILNRAIQGLQRVLFRSSFDPPKDCLDAATKMMANANPFVGFVTHCCRPEPGKHVTLNDFRTKLYLWAKEQGFKSVPAPKTIKYRLEAVGYNVTKVTGYHRVNGLEIKPESEWGLL